MKNDQLSILLIEDNESDAQMVRMYLSGHFKEPYNLRLAGTLKEGMDLLTQKRPDIVLLDLNLPDSATAEALDFVLKHRRRFAVIIMSGDNQPEVRMKAIKAGAQDFLVKGEFDGKLLARAIHYAIERYSLQRKLRSFAKELNDKRLKLTEAQAIAQLGHWELDAFDMQFAWGTQAAKILEIKSSQTSLIDFLNMVVEGDRRIIREVFRQAIEDDSEFNIDVAVGMGDETIKYINLRVRSNHAKELEKKVVVGTLQDITARKTIEDDLKESEEKYHNLFEDSRDAIYITTTDGAFIEFNKATLDLFGYDRLELKTLNVKDLYLNPFERVKFKKEIEEHGFVRDFEVKLRKKDGTKIDCVITSTLWLSNDGKQVGYQGVIRDITEKRRAEELTKEVEVAERSGKLKERFLANMSHEIRTPINAISGLSHLLLQTDLSGRQLEYITGIRSSAEHLLELVNDILDFSKIEEGKVQFENIPFDIHQVLTQSINTLQFRAADKHLELLLEMEPEVPHLLKGDPLRLKQILINLITNAVKFTEKGAVRLVVKVVEAGAQDYVLSFSVEDTGIGIPEDKLGTIFSSFTQLGYDVSKPEGTGLGLAITRQLVELQGGNISVKSKEGEGTVFKVVLKYRKADTGTTGQKVQDAFSFPVEDIGGKRILIVEDKPLNQLVAREMLLKWWPGLDIDIADNGRIGVEKVERKVYDIVLMDVQMPEMDGYEASRYIRNRLPFPANEIPILAMTAYATTGEAEKCIDAGMSDYISKPFDPKTLYEKIVSLVLHRHVRVERAGDHEAETASAAETLDLSYLNQISGGNEELRKQIMDLLIKETPEEIVQLMQHTAAADWLRVRGVSHKMKSSATYMGLKVSLNLLKKIEENANLVKQVETIPAMVKEVETNFNAALEALKTEYSRV